MIKNLSNPDVRLRILAGLSSVIVGFLLLLIKFYAYSLTHSTAVLSDALESVVNIVAALFALGAIIVSHLPPDRNHPYGHGKVEFLTAAFEGGLIAFAALLIGYEAIRAIIEHSLPHELDTGIILLFFAGIGNGLWGLSLIKAGKKTHSTALIADGKHLITDFITSLALVGGLFIVHITKLIWLDSLLAVIMACILGYTGYRVLQQAADALLDAESPELLQKLLHALEKLRSPGVIRIHHVRAMRNGRRIHVDGHVVVPEFWSIDRTHDFIEDFENKVIQDAFLEGEIEFHIDPCRKLYCKSCDIADCPIRVEAFHSRRPQTIEELVNPMDITDKRH